MEIFVSIIILSIVPAIIANNKDHSFSFTHNANNVWEFNLCLSMYFSNMPKLIKSSNATKKNSHNLKKLIWTKNIIKNNRVKIIYY